ncbi:MAG: hypothetical protein HY369_00570 [Candidatus Aenigmarchaeota archaeon]|nr:hypothetical protein [Candidatus Aenigmarchaeota archaeon]
MSQHKEFDICRRCGRPAFPWRQLALVFAMMLLQIAIIAALIIPQGEVGILAAAMIGASVGIVFLPISRIVIQRLGRRKTSWICTECVRRNAAGRISP